MSERLLTAGEVAEMLAVPESWVREHTGNGKLPAVPLGRYWRYRPSKVLEWIEEQEQGGAPWRKYQPNGRG